MNDTLPITEYRDQILETVADNQVVIITAETGAGKSTQVPQYLYGAGYAVVVTQPRRLAARSVASRVADEMSCTFGETVGYRTAEDRRDSPETRILFCTDGLQLVRELQSRNDKQQVLVIDEVHEWNLNIETLVAWVKYRISRGFFSKVVLMSATIEAERLSEYFGGAPVITVPGRMYPVEERYETVRYGQDPVEVCIAETETLALAGRDVLTFLPGKAEINRAVTELEKRLGDTSVVLPLHGELTADQQQRVFPNYGPKIKIIVSTDVAQTSVTVDVDAVVDSGLERRTEERDGFEGLYLGDISRADCKQRKGRAGRTKPGIYVLCAERRFENRQEFPTAEILRVRLDQMVLRLAAAGFDATELEFFHQPDKRKLVLAKQALIRLGALDASGSVTSTGKAMSRLPVDVHLARMIIESKKRGVVDDVLIIAACLQVKGIRDKGKRVQGIQYPPQWRTLTSEEDSDLLAELDCFKAAESLTKKAMSDLDINVKRFYKAKELRNRMAREVGANRAEKSAPDRTEILKSCVVGMIDNLYWHTFKRSYVSAGGHDTRELDKNSVVAYAELVTAQPLDLELRDKDDQPFILSLLTFVSKVEMAWLLELMPNRVAEKVTGEVKLDASTMSAACVISVTFDGKPIAERTEVIPASDVSTFALCTLMARGEADYTAADYNRAQLAAYNLLVNRHPDRLTRIGNDEMTRRLTAAINRQRTEPVSTLHDLEGLDLKLDLLAEIPDELREQAVDMSPETVEVNGTQITITYLPLSSWGSGLRATYHIPLEVVDRLVELPRDPRGSMMSEVDVVEGDGNVVVSGYSLRDIKWQFEERAERARRAAERQRLAEELDALRRRAHELAENGCHVVGLYRLINEARSLLDWGNRAEVRPKIRRIENEIDRLVTNPVGVVVDSLMSGRISHLDHRHNLIVQQRVTQLYVRANSADLEGLVDPITDDTLREHYRARLEAAERLDNLESLDLKLTLDLSTLDELEELLELAPESVELTGNKGKAVSYDVAYGLDDEGRSIGVIRLPINVYEKYAYEYGKESQLPKLPGGVILIIDVYDPNGNKPVAKGEDGEWLVGRIKKHKSGKQRSRNTDEQYVLSAPPSWHVRTR